MNENRTASILQRLPVILAVTAASYGLQVAQATTRPAAAKPGATSISKARPVNTERLPAR